MKTYFLDDKDMEFLDEVEEALESSRVQRGYEVSEALCVRLREMLRQLRKHAPPEFKMPGLKEPLPEGVPMRARPAMLPPRAPRPGEIVGGT